MQTINLCITETQRCPNATSTRKYVAVSRQSSAHTHIQSHVVALVNAEATEIHSCTVVISPGVEACSGRAVCCPLLKIMESLQPHVTPAGHQREQKFKLESRFFLKH